MERLTRYIGSRAASTGDMGDLKYVRAIIDRLAAYENTGLEPSEIPSGLELANVFAALQELKRYKDAEEQGLLARLPCKVGSTVWVVTKCENVAMRRDDDYLDGTGEITCPFENSCDTEDCDDSHIRMFETVVNDFWYGTSNNNHPEIYLEDIAVGYMRSDIGKTVFLTREAAEAALAKMTDADVK